MKKRSPLRGTCRVLLVGMALVTGLSWADARPSDAHTRRKYIWFSWDTQNCSAEEVLAKAALCVKTRALGLVFPENRAKYAAAISASFGFFMDAYVRPNEQDRYWFGPLNGSRLGTFDDNLAGATFWCDE